MDETVDPIRSNVAKKETRDSNGRFVSKTDPTKIPPITINTNPTGNVNTTNPPDFLNFKITNPLVYIKYWWKKIMQNEGIDIRIRARPMIVFGVAIIAFSLAFGLGGIVLPIAIPGLKINNKPVVTPTPNPIEWKDTALKGTLQKTSTTPVKFYLLGSADEAICLEVPENINLLSMVGKRILAIGTYDSKDKILKVIDVQDLEILPTTPVPIPTSSPTPLPTILPTVKPTITPTEVPTQTP